MKSQEIQESPPLGFGNDNTDTLVISDRYRMPTGVTTTRVLGIFENGVIETGIVLIELVLARMVPSVGDAEVTSCETFP